MINNSWDSVLQKEYQKPYFQELQQFIEQEYNAKTIFPIREEVFTALELTPPEAVKVVILGQDPYHNFNQAHGLAFSVLKGNDIPPSLKNIYKELHADVGVPIPTHGELTTWAEQGVLLLNTILTVEAHKPLSHKNKGWETFTTAVIQYLNDDDRPKVFVLWGNNAKEKRSMITNKHHFVIESSHPSPLSARYSFFGSKVFSRINDFLKASGQVPINFFIK